MIGVFDSGVGGLCAFYELRRRLRSEDIVYLADRKNAPYGTKSKDELIRLTAKDISRLRTLGARRILIACCTASSIYGELSLEDRAISLPIITPAAEVAANYGNVAIIATEHTVRQGVFSKEIQRLSHTKVFEFAHQGLVSAIECGYPQGDLARVCREHLNLIKNQVLGCNAEALVLGCTHFSHLEGCLKELLPHVRIISPAREGALRLVKQLGEELQECGKILYT